MPRKMMSAVAGRLDLVAEDLNRWPRPSAAILLSISRLDDCASVLCASRMQTASVPRSAWQLSTSSSPKKWDFPEPRPPIGALVARGRQQRLEDLSCRDFQGGRSTGPHAMEEQARWRAVRTCNEVDDRESGRVRMRHALLRGFPIEDVWSTHEAAKAAADRRYRIRFGRRQHPRIWIGGVNSGQSGEPASEATRRIQRKRVTCALPEAVVEA